MRRPLSFDDMEELEVTAGTPEQHRAASRQLQQWATEVHPDDDGVTPAALLVAAGDHLERADDLEAGLELYRAAVDAEGDASPDARVHVHHLLLSTGRTDEARALAEQVRRSRPAAPDVHLFIGENYEVAGDLQQANRWFTMGLAAIERDAVAAEPFNQTMLLTSRYRVRQALGFPPDEDDDEAAAELAQRRANFEVLGR